MVCSLAVRFVATIFHVATMPARMFATRGHAGGANLCQGRSPLAIAERRGCRRRGRAAWTQSPPVTRFATRDCPAGFIAARLHVTRGSVHRAWCVWSRGAAVAHQARWWSATWSRWKSSVATSLVAARRTVGGTGAMRPVARCRSHLLSMKVTTWILISARYHVARSSGVDSMDASISATVVTVILAARPYSVSSLVPVEGHLFRHRSRVAHQLHHAHTSASSLSLVGIQLHTNAILGTARLALCQ